MSLITSFFWIVAIGLSSVYTIIALYCVVCLIYLRVFSKADVESEVVIAKYNAILGAPMRSTLLSLRRSLSFCLLFAMVTCVVMYFFGSVDDHAIIANVTQRLTLLCGALCIVSCGFGLTTTLCTPPDVNITGDALSSVTTKLFVRTLVVGLLFALIYWFVSIT